jgi:hypothetical protein
MRNRFADSARYGRRAVIAAEAIGDPTVLADALLRLSRTLYWSGGPHAARAAAERALPLLNQLGDEARLANVHAELARAWSDLATVGPVAEPTSEVVEHAEQSLRLAERLGDDYLRCHALQYRGTGRLGLDDPRGFDDLALAVELAQLDPRDEMPTRACVNASGGCFRAGRLDEAERYAILGLDRASGGEFSAGAYRLELTLQGVRSSRGAWEEAERGLRMLVEWPGEPGIMRPLAASLLARLLSRQGRHAEAAELLGPAMVSASNSSEIALVGPAIAAAVEAAWLVGRTDDMPPSPRRGWRSQPSSVIASRSRNSRATSSEPDTRLLRTNSCRPADPGNQASQGNGAKLRPPGPHMDAATNAPSSWLWHPIRSRALMVDETSTFSARRQRSPPSPERRRDSRQLLSLTNRLLSSAPIRREAAATEIGRPPERADTGTPSPRKKWAGWALKVSNPPSLRCLTVFVQVAVEAR